MKKIIINRRKVNKKKMSDVIIHSMDYVLTETNYKDQYEDFKLELDGVGLREYVEKDNEEIINETVKENTKIDYNNKIQ